jgi:hypothetical protein
VRNDQVGRGEGGRATSWRGMGLAIPHAGDGQVGTRAMRHAKLVLDSKS